MNKYRVWETDKVCNPINKKETFVFATNISNAIKQVYQDRNIDYPIMFSSPIRLENGNLIFVKYCQ